MKMTRFHRLAFTLALSAPALAAIGCAHKSYPNHSLYAHAPAAPGPLGTLTDPVWQMQEDNAEAEKFVVYQHEFDYNTIRLNHSGEDHVKQIAARLTAGQNFPVIVERSFTSPILSTEYKYPVHANPELDMRRREIIVQCLLALGVADAQQRVVVSMAIARGYSDQEAERAYWRSFWGGGGGGFGGGFGGFGGFGGIR